MISWHEEYDNKKGFVRIVFVLNFKYIHVDAGAVNVCNEAFNSNVKAFMFCNQCSSPC